MLKLSILLLVGTWLSFPRDFLHQKFTQLLSFSRIGIVVKCKLFSALYFITSKAMAVANCEAQ